MQELQKEEQEVADTVKADFAKAREFVERIEKQYTLPPFLRWLYKLGVPMPDM